MFVVEMLMRLVVVCEADSRDCLKLLASGQSHNEIRAQIVYP